MFTSLMNEPALTATNIGDVILEPSIKKMYRREDKEEHRGSDYRGVSKNGNRW